MPNSFTVFPNVLPGNVSIGGNLTVNGDQLRIGAAAPFVRLGKDINTDLELSTNLGFDRGTRDDLSKAAFDICESANTGIFFVQRTNPAGTIRNEANQTAIFTDYTAHNHTGTVTEDTIYSKLIPANTLGANGGLRILMFVNANPQGAAAATIKLKFGANTPFSFTFTAANQFIVELYLRNRNAANSNVVVGLARTIGNAFIGNQYNGGSAIDFSVDQTFSVTAQNGATTDVQSFDAIAVHQDNSFGPV